ncbi:MAG: FAD-linked oxidase C-terminal domain-containing protein [Desulfobacterium sp.]
MKDEQLRQGLVQALGSAIQGEIRFDGISRQLYSTDASDYRKVPMGVVLPANIDDICAVVDIAGKYGVSIIPRGGGSSLSGQTVGPGVILDLSKYVNHILDINVEEQWADVQSGVVLDVLNAALLPHELMVGPDPSSSAVATLGGMSGNNSTGSHSIKYRMIVDHIQEVDVVLADGTRATLGPKSPEQVAELVERNSAEGKLYRGILDILKEYKTDIETGYPDTWRNVAGYNLKRLVDDQNAGKYLNLMPLVVGAEGTLATITRIRVGLVPRPRAVRLMVLHFNDMKTALERVPFLLEHGPSAVELMTHPTLKLAHDNSAYQPTLQTFVHGLPGAILIVEFAGKNEESIAKKVQGLEQSLADTGYDTPISHCVTPEEVGKVWWVRKSILGLLMSKPGDDNRRIWIIDDATVPVDRMVEFTEAILAAGRELGFELNFDAHASAGCLHMGPEINMKTVEGLASLERLAQKIMDIAIAHKGTTTGEHGEGLARSYFNRQLYGERLYQAFREVKALFDPDNLFNPHKMIDAPEPWDQDWLKYKPGYSSSLSPEKTFFDFSSHGGFAGLVEMCNGQGGCRSRVSGTMCPSFRISGEEMDSTRGRANALRAAITGNLGTDGLGSTELYEVMDLCVACKACRNECSTRVDMAKLKFEFLAQYQAQHGVPLRSRMIGYMHLSSRLGSLMPGLVNYLYKNSLFRELLDKTVKIHRRRTLPAIAPVTFQHWFKHRIKPPSSSRGPVVLWDDCHISYHQPELGKDAVRILEAAGFEVILVEDRRCCGRPLISKGMLAKATEHARHNVAMLVSHARQGTPIVGVEPSCITCFRDEYPDLLKNQDAHLVAQNSFFIEEFIAGLMSQGEVEFIFKHPLDKQTIMVHTHCYQKALGTSDPVITMLEALPETKVSLIDSGCCGMAGSFGYEKEHYDTSMAIGELSLFPAVRGAAPGVMIAAPGTSCREQIKDGTQQRALHPISIFAAALR